MTLSPEERGACYSSSPDWFLSTAKGQSYGSPLYKPEGNTGKACGGRTLCCVGQQVFCSLTAYRSAHSHLCTFSHVCIITSIVGDILDEHNAKGSLSLSVFLVISAHTTLVF